MAGIVCILLLLVPLITIYVSADVFTSIDCGATGSYTDSNGIPWDGDDQYIANGESQVVQNAASIPQDLTTLRAFTTRKKNCYSIAVDKGGKVLVRANFFYGNYDRKSSPPTFDLQFDGNYWATITTSMDQSLSFEAIYIAKWDAVSVCVAQTHPNQIPFISSIEVRSLNSSMYNKVDAEFALFTQARFAYGAADTIRFTDDPYDRIWTAAAASNGLTAITSDASFVTTTDVAEDPPEKAMQTAVTSADTAHSIILSSNELVTDNDVPIYINAYFSEVTELGSTDKRSFQMFINNDKILDPLNPPFESVLEATIFNVTANANTTMSLVATADSTLPPIINALEFFSVSNQLTNGTDASDVQALSLLQQQFEKLQEWSGDPCLPPTFNWDWVNCSSDPIPRITALYLNELQLSGTLPNFNSFDALQIIDMHNNSINGAIPDSLGKLPNLKQLNLSDNDFSGPLPSSLLKNNKIKLDISGNPNLCISGKKCNPSSSGTSPGIGTTPESGTSTNPSSGKSKSKLPTILGATIPSFVVFWAIVGFFVFTYQRRKAIATGKINQPSQAAPNNYTGQVHPTQGQTPADNQDQIGEDNLKIDITEQVGSELDDLMRQQAEANDHDNYHQYLS